MIQQIDVRVNIVATCFRKWSSACSPGFMSPPHRGRRRGGGIGYQAITPGRMSASRKWSERSVFNAPEAASVLGLPWGPRGPRQGAAASAGLSGQHVFHRSGGVGAHPWYHVRVGVQRDGDVGVSQKLLDVLRVDVAGQE